MTKVVVLGPVRCQHGCRRERVRIRTEILEKVGQAVEEDESTRGGGRCRELVIRKAHDDKEDCEDGKAHKLNWLAPPAIDEEEGSPVARNETSSGDDQVANGNVLEIFVHLARAGKATATAEADRSKDDGRIETETVKGDVEGEPGPCTADEDFEVLTLAEVVGKVLARRFGSIDALDDRIGVDVEGTGGEEVVDVVARLLHVALDVHREARGLWDGETVVEGDNAGEAAEPDEDAPHVVDVGQDGGVIGKEGASECSGDNQCDKSGGKVAPALEGKDGGHETAADVGGGELGGDDGGEWIVAADSYTHDEAPDDEDTKDIDTVCVTSKSLTKGGDDDDHELDTI